MLFFRLSEDEKFVVGSLGGEGNIEGGLSWKTCQLGIFQIKTLPVDCVMACMDG